MTITRRKFGSTLGGISVMVWLQGCNGEDDGSFFIGGNHANGPHSIFIDANDIAEAEAAADGETFLFDIIGEAQHNHVVVFSKADLLKLKLGQRISAVSGFSTDGDQHQHQVTVFEPAS